jgi:hypothetical protein
LTVNPRQTLGSFADTLRVYLRADGLLITIKLSGCLHNFEEIFFTDTELSIFLMAFDSETFSTKFSTFPCDCLRVSNFIPLAAAHGSSLKTFSLINESGEPIKRNFQLSVKIFDFHSWKNWEGCDGE